MAETDVASPAILAAPSKQVEAYVRQVLHACGGLHGAEDISVRFEKTQLMIEKVGQKIELPLPARASSVISAIQRLAISSSAAPLAIGPYRLLPHEWLLLDAEERGIRLTEKEVSILLTLHHQAGRALSRRDLLDQVWGYAQNVETHTLETHIYRLRQKLEKDPSAPEILVTLEDGYALSAT